MPLKYTDVHLLCVCLCTHLQVAMCGKAIGEEDVEAAVDEHRDKVGTVWVWVWVGVGVGVGVGV